MLARRHGVPGDQFGLDHREQPRRAGRPRRGQSQRVLQAARGGGQLAAHGIQRSLPVEVGRQLRVGPVGGGDAVPQRLGLAEQGARLPVQLAAAGQPDTGVNGLVHQRVAEGEPASGGPRHLLGQPGGDRLVQRGRARCRSQPMSRPARWPARRRRTGRGPRPRTAGPRPARCARRGSPRPSPRWTAGPAARPRPGRAPGAGRAARWRTAGYRRCARAAGRPPPGTGRSGPAPPRAARVLPGSARPA